MQKTKHWLMTIAVLLCSVAASAHDFEVGGIYYNITYSTDLTVTYKGDYNDSYFDEYSGSVTIPSTVSYDNKTYRVTSIGSGAFSDCQSVTSITIPESVTSIGDYAFYDCGSLTTVTLPEGVTSIGVSAFGKCCSLTAITIPEGVTSIGYGAFSDCQSLTSITIPESVTSIGGYAFEGTTWYNNQSDGVIYVGKMLYKYKGTMPSNTSITVKEGTISITSYAFSGCSNLTAITIPESVTSIGNRAFYNCTWLTTITIPENSQLTSIEDEAFDGTAWYNNQSDGVIYAGKVLYDYKGTIPSNTSITVKEGTISITPYAFSGGCSNLTSITLPEGVTSIGDHAFEYCSNLTTINIPESVTIIGDYAFCDCGSLKTVTIPENSQLTSIGGYAFRDCSKLTTITIPKGVTSIGECAFVDCYRLTTITIPENSQLTSIGYGAFESCSLTSITIPESVTSIGNGAFRYCSSLTTINIPENSQLTSIGDGAFGDCSSLTTITIPEGVTSIGDGAFSGCSSLTTITIPESVTSIGNNAFSHCSQLFNVYCYAKSAPAAYDYTFHGIPSDAILHVPASAIEDYRNTAPWNKFNTIETIETFEIAVTSITLSNSSAQLKEGESMVLNAVVTPDNATDKTVSWTSSNPAVATVDADGTVTAMLEGTAIITATANDGSGVSASCEVTVKEKPYEVIFMVDGEVYHTCSSEDVTFPEAPEKQNHTFVEWLEGDDVVLEEVDLKNNADAMLYTNAKCTNTQWGDQFVGWHVLFDVDPNTFFHSEYSNVNSEDGLDHYIRVDMGKGKSVSEFTFTYTVRGEIPYMGNYSPKQMVVEGSNTENGEYTEIASLIELPSGAGAVYESPILGNGNKYRYIRFRVTETYQNKKVHGHPYFFMAEFGLKSSKKTRVYHAVYNLHSISININRYGSATYCSEYALDFSEVEGLKAYAATGYKTSTGIVTLTRVMTSQPGMGLFLKGEPGDEYAVPILESTDENSLNMLVGTLESTPVNGTSDDGQYYNYRYTIHDGDAEPMFYRVDDGYTLGAGKAYLQIPVVWMPAEAKAIAMRFDDGGTTDIEDIESGIQHSELIYDLMGRKVTHPQKGVVYIVNGKKVIW